MTPRQWIVLFVALIAGLGALFFMRQTGGGRPASATAPVDAGPMVLTTARDVAMGTTVTSQDLVWVAWPQAALNPTFVQKEKAPTAIEQLTGAVARTDLRKGEPIYDGRLVKRGDRGVFAAILTPGYRAVALDIDADSASAGFIAPGDRVDVILARTVQITRNGEQAEEVRAGVVLENVRVIAMGEHASPPASEGGVKPIKASVVTLELSARDAETLTMAKRMGAISLVLRGIEIEPSNLRVASQRRDSGALAQNPGALGEPIKVHAFGSVSDTQVFGAGP